MPDAEQMAEAVRSLNEIAWNQAPEITPAAEALVREHVARMREVMEFLKAEKGLPPTEAYAEAQSAGYDAPGYDAFMDMLFDEVKFRGANFREHLILALASYFFWGEDRDVGHLNNPWEPMLELYRQGYTSSFEEDEAEQRMDVVLSYRDGIKSYRLI